MNKKKKVKGYLYIGLSFLMFGLIVTFVFFEQGPLSYKHFSYLRDVATVTTERSDELRQEKETKFHALTTKVEEKNIIQEKATIIAEKYEALQIFKEKNENLSLHIPSLIMVIEEKAKESDLNIIIHFDDLRDSSSTIPFSKNFKYKRFNLEVDGDYASVNRFIEELEGVSFVLPEKIQLERKGGTIHALVGVVVLFSEKG